MRTSANKILFITIFLVFLPISFLLLDNNPILDLIYYYVFFFGCRKTNLFDSFEDKLTRFGSISIKFITKKKRKFKINTIIFY